MMIHTIYYMEGLNSDNYLFCNVARFFYGTYFEGPRGYTKHYYNGSQRIAARIGGHWHDESVFVSSPALTNAAESLWAATLHSEELQEQETPFDEVYVSPAGTFLPVPQYGPVVANLSGMHADDLLSSVFSGHNSERTSDNTVGIYWN